jgi:hypothetical protein
MMRRIWDEAVALCFQVLLIAVFATGTIVMAMSVGGLWVYAVSGHQLWAWDHGKQPPADINNQPVSTPDAAAYLLRPGCT